MTYLDFQVMEYFIDRGQKEGNGTSRGDITEADENFSRHLEQVIGDKSSQRNHNSHQDRVFC